MKDGVTSQDVHKLVVFMCMNTDRWYDTAVREHAEPPILTINIGKLAWDFHSADLLAGYAP